MIIVSNTTPIITLIKANKLEILKLLFEEVFISVGVYDELKPILDLLIESNIRISTKLYEDILQKARKL